MNEVPPTPKVGQVWGDNDPRSAGRELVIRHIIGEYAICTSTGGRTTRIRLNRFRPTRTRLCVLEGRAMSNPEPTGSIPETANAEQPEQSRTEIIKCPTCGTEQQAKIELYPGEPWPRYLHVCTNCTYIIMESEWER